MSSFPRWCLFYDFHTMPANPDVGKGFDFERIADGFVAAGVGYVVFPARCNLGVAYYDTKLGVRHPALTYDLLSCLVDACHRRGIKISAYMNVGLSHEEGLRHRDWLVMDGDGRTYQQDKLNSFFRQMCYNTEYGDHVVAMAQEILEVTGVDGLFLDCLQTRPCFGKECLDSMKAAGVDWNDAAALQKYNQGKITGIARRISEAARSVKPDCILYFNGVGFETQLELGSYLEFECLPTGGWGYELLQVGARYLRTLERPVLNMTGRFHRSWGDFGGIRTEASLEYDCLYGIANGMRTTIGDHFHPRGDINKAVMSLETGIYKRLQRLEPWIADSKPVVEVGVLMLKPYPGLEHFGPERRSQYMQEFTAVKGVTRMLCEMKMQFDVVSKKSDWNRYDVLILADYTELDDDVVSRLQSYLLSGKGRIFASYHAGLSSDGSGFVFKEWGVEYCGESPWDPAFFVPEGDGMSKDIPDMPHNFYGKGVEVSSSADSCVLATLVKPYYNRHWDGDHGFVYLPPDCGTGQPVAVGTERVCYVAHDIFTSYYQSGSVVLRTLFRNMLERLLPRPLVQAPGAPSFARITVTGQENGSRMVHYLAYQPETRGAGANMIEEPLTVVDAVVRLRLDKGTVRRVYLAPDMRELDFELCDDGYVSVAVDKIIGYAHIVFEQ